MARDHAKVNHQAFLPIGVDAVRLAIAEVSLLLPFEMNGDRFEKRRLALPERFSMFLMESLYKGHQRLFAGSGYF